MNDRVIPFFTENNIRLTRILTDRGTKYCGNVENHPYHLYLSIKDIDHSKTKVRSPHTNVICERFHRTIKDEYYYILFRKKIYKSLEASQIDVDQWLNKYNVSRPYSAKYCYAKTPMQTFFDSKNIAIDKYHGFDNIKEKFANVN